MAGKLKRGDKIVIATHNPGKVRELGELFAPLGIDCISAASLGLAEPEETGDSFAANAKLKAEAAAEASGLTALADDSGLEVSGLRRRARHPRGALGWPYQGLRPCHATGAARA